MISPESGYKIWKTIYYHSIFRVDDSIELQAAA